MVNKRDGKETRGKDGKELKVKGLWIKILKK